MFSKFHLIPIIIYEIPDLASCLCERTALLTNPRKVKEQRAKVKVSLSCTIDQFTIERGYLLLSFIDWEHLWKKLQSKLLSANSRKSW